VAAATSATENKVARWLEAIAYALMALVGIGILAILMLWSIVRELRRMGRSPP
jgi:ABC-type nickel/cobalt efflux system permease component RcnA